MAAYIIGYILLIQRQSNQALAAEQMRTLSVVHRKLYGNGAMSENQLTVKSKKTNQNSLLK